MKTDSNRADRILIGVALAIILLAMGLFYFDSWMWGERRDRGERIGVISEKAGDVRVKFDGDLKWDKASRGQDLMYNDSIYSGNGSQAKVQLGESEMTVTENTLIVLRRENLTNFLNLNYGTLFGKLGKNEKVIIDTGNGKPVELSTKQPSQIVLSKKDGKIKLDVVQGKADVVVDGQKKTVEKASSMTFEPKAVPKVEKAKLLALRPLKDQVTHSETPTRIEFNWAWSEPRRPGPEETYTLEFSAQPSFDKILTRKSVKGQLSTSMAVSQTLSLWYRVRGPEGELTPIERVNFVRLGKPVIIKPIANQHQLTPSEQKAMVEFLIQRPKASSVWYQVAQDPDFNNLIVNQNATEERTFQELGVGQYFVRARGDYGDNRLTEWTAAVPFNIDPKLKIRDWPQVPTLSRVLIPNRSYPSNLYAAPRAEVREFLARGGFLREFFPFGKDSFDEIRIKFEGEAQTIQQTHAGWPVKNLHPGNYRFQYQVSKSGYEMPPVSPTKRLEIMMEPPMALGEARAGEPEKDGRREMKWRFTPLLFAASYDVELAGDADFGAAKQLRADQPEMSAKLMPGQYFWRARARDQKGRIISDYSSPKQMVVPEVVPVFLAKNERLPAAAEKTKTKIERVQTDNWQKSGWWAWIGAGVNFIDYRQSVNGRYGLNSQTVKGPSQYFETGYTGNNGFGGVVSLKGTPGELIIEGTPVPNPNYNWTTVSIEGILRRTSSFTLASLPITYGLRLGVQQHKAPITFIDADASPTLHTNSMNTASMGVQAEWARKRWTYSWLMRYQLPLSSKADDDKSLSISPTFAFDGSLGTSYNLTKQMKLGAFWYGQWHQYNFVYADSEVTNSGFQSIFYSNMDIRLGFDF